jgi:mannose-6-phosphate isomerase class I
LGNYVNKGSGFIIEKHISSDMLLRNDKTDNIFDIAQINEVWTIANVNENDINQVRSGENASVTTLSDLTRKGYKFWYFGGRWLH